MKTPPRGKQPASAESIARKADAGQDISGFFTNRGRLVRPVQRVNLDLTASMLEELDHAAAEMNISRQAVIKSLIRHALDQHYAARSGQPAPLAATRRRPERQRESLAGNRSPHSKRPTGATRAKSGEPLKTSATRPGASAR